MLTSVCSTIGYSQNVSGVVSDSRGTLNGVSVTVKGTKNGTSSEADGSYTLKNIGSNATLVFTYLGMKSKSVAVDGQSVLNVVLEDEGADLKEVVVIGYGTVKKKDATGAVDILSNKKFDNISSVSPAEILRGKVAGVQVTNSSGEPGAATSIRIRGNGSLRSGNGPLIVVDGVPLAGGDVSSGASSLGLGTSTAKNPLSFINQNDIESMSILKDASSTAIYGARGANGVIVITTKKGKSKEPEFTYATSVSTSTYASKFDVMSREEFLATPLGAANNKGGSYEWKDAILRTAIGINHDFAFSSATEKSNTRVSIGVSESEGIVNKTGLDKYTASLYNSNDFIDGRLKVETRLSYSVINDQRGLITNNAGFVGNLLSSALRWNPTQSLLDATQPSGYTFLGDTDINPAHIQDSYTNDGVLNKFLGNITSTFKLRSDLKYSFVIGFEKSNSKVSQQATPDLIIQDFAVATNPTDQRVYRGQATIASDDRINKTIEHNLTYNKSFSDNFSLNAILGYSYYAYQSNGNFVLGKGFPNSQRNLLENIAGGIPTEFRSTSYRGLEEIQSVFGRASLNLYKKLNVDLTVRRDGSSKAASGLKYGTFPSIGLGYKVVEGKEGMVNDLKVRFNAGKTGNIEFPRNSSLSLIRYNGSNEFVPVNNANSELTWETSTSYGVGADFTLLKNRLTGSVDYFQKSTTNLIIGIPSTSGQPSPQGIKYKNLEGELINKGFEIGLNYKIIDKQDLTWDFAANAAFLQNKVQNLGASNVFDVAAIDGQGLSNEFVQRIQDGYPVYNYYLKEFTGYNAAGDSQYSTDKQMLDKQPLPKVTLGFSTNVSYKSFDFSTSFYGSFGHYLYNNTNNALFYKGQLGARNVTPAVANSPQNVSDANTASTKYLEKGDFLRMGSLTLGYNFSGGLLEAIKIKNARLFVNGANLFVITNYSGFDPEVDTEKTLNGIPSAGIDYLAYPRARTFTLGLNVTL